MFIGQRSFELDKYNSCFRRSVKQGLAEYSININARSWSRYVWLHLCSIVIVCLTVGASGNSAANAAHETLIQILPVLHQDKLCLPRGLFIYLDMMLEFFACDFRRTICRNGTEFLESTTSEITRAYTDFGS
jgi:uncharacterized membrane protein